METEPDSQNKSSNIPLGVKKKSPAALGGRSTEFYDAGIVFVPLEAPSSTKELLLVHYFSPGG